MTGRVPILFVLCLVPGTVCLAQGTTRRKEQLDDLVIRLSSDSPAERNKAVQGLAEIGPDAARAIPALIGDIEKHKYSSAGRALVAIGPASVPALVEVLGSRESRVREKCAQVLGDMGTVARPAVPTIKLLLEDRAWLVRSAAIHALARIAPDDPDVIGAICTGLRHQEDATRDGAARTLARLGPKARAAVPALIQSLDLGLFGFYTGHPSDQVEALIAMGPTVIPDLVKALEARDTGEKGRAQLAETLALFGGEAKAAVPMLLRLLKDRSALVRRWSVTALSAIAPGD
ncbi:MAG: HEAT repeat domain-containing protein, partial [Planctomycetota bacterium]